MVHPSLCQLLFECQSPDLVSTVFSGKILSPHCENSPLNWFTTGYCIAHSDATSSWNLDCRDAQCFKALFSGLHYSSVTPQAAIELFLLTNLFSSYFQSLHPYTQAVTQLSVFGNDLDTGCKDIVQCLSYYCPRLKRLILGRLQPPYLSLVPQFPQQTLQDLTLWLPLMKDDMNLGFYLVGQCTLLKRLCLAANKSVTSYVLSMFDVYTISIMQKLGVTVYYILYFVITVFTENILAHTNLTTF